MPPMTLKMTTSPGDHKEDEVGGGELVLDRIEHAGESREEAQEHHRDDLVVLDVVADGARARLVLADRLEHFPERRLRDTPESEVRERHDAEHEPVERDRRGRWRRSPGWRTAAGGSSVRSRYPSPRSR